MEAIKKKEWAIKIEDLNYSEKYAEQIETTLYDFLEDGIGYATKEWIQPINCRRYDGFIPYSNNKGGFQAHQYSDQLTHYFEPTGFKKFDAVCENTYNYVIECGLEDREISLGDFNKGLDNNDYDMVSIRDEIEESFGEYEQSCFETMLKIEDNNTLFVAFMLKASDAPYFRGYDDSLDFEIKFTNIFELKTELNKLLENKDVQTYINLLNY